MSSFNSNKFATILFVIVIVTNISSASQKHQPRKWEVSHQWQYINFTWQSYGHYQDAVNSQRYVPQNNGFSGIKTYNETFYFGMPRFSPGTPVTLASLPIASKKEGALLSPYPSWEMNEGESCLTFQNVQATEIEPNGVMWVLDGNRFNNLTRCPPKIVILDINNNGTILQVYEVPNELSPHRGGWLNDLVIDSSDGGYAFISEVSAVDPGIIVYSRRENKAWKFRDASMFAERNSAGFVVKGITVNNLYNVDGIALAPVPKLSSYERLFYYSPLTGYSFYALSTRVLKNESFSQYINWRNSIKYVGEKPSIADGMIIDNEGNLYMGLITKYGIGKWNIYTKPFNVETVYQNYTTVDWPDSFGFDNNGNLYVTADEAERVLTGTLGVPADHVRFRILKCHTGTKSYMYS